MLFASADAKKKTKTKMKLKKNSMDLAVKKNLGKEGIFIDPLFLSNYTATATRV